MDTDTFNCLQFLSGIAALLVNAGVAAGTLALAWFAYWSAKASEKTAEEAKKFMEIEKQKASPWLVLERRRDFPIMSTLGKPFDPIDGTWSIGLRNTGGGVATNIRYSFCVDGNSITFKEFKDKARSALNCGGDEKAPGGLDVVSYKFPETMEVGEHVQLVSLTRVIGVNISFKGYGELTPMLDRTSICVSYETRFGEVVTIELKAWAESEVSA